jgi:6-phosphogluconolactonase
MEAAARSVAALARGAVAQRGRFCWALAGGSTPRALYERLAQGGADAELDWSRTDLFWGDERCVGPDDPRSNYRMVREALLDRVAAQSGSGDSAPAAARIDPRHVHRMRGEDDPAQAAAAYEAELRRYFAPATSARFDLVLLGMGADGHTASLFADSPALAEQDRWVLPTVAPDGGARVTLTLPAINAAAHVILLVAGVDKAARVRESLTGTHAVLPVQHIRPHHGQLEWLLDAQAAGGLT